MLDMNTLAVNVDMGLSEMSSASEGYKNLLNGGLSRVESDPPSDS